MATPALKRMSELGIEYTVYFLDQPIMNIYRHCLWMKNKKWGTLPPPGARTIKLEAGQALNHALSTGQHYAYGFAAQLGVSIDNPAPDCDFYEWPDQYNYTHLLPSMLNTISLSTKPTLLIFPESSSCSSTSGLPANKMLPWYVWRNFYQLAEPHYRIWFITPAKNQNLDGLPHLFGFDIQEIAFLLRAATKVLTVDNGIGHLSAAVGANCYLVGGCVPIPWIFTGPQHKTLDCKGQPHTVTVQHLLTLIK